MTVSQVIADNIEAKARATISGANCAKKVKADVVVRGAQLSTEKLKVYKKGNFIVEPAFTSTTIGDEVVQDFRGNVEFQIFDSVGVDLTELSGISLGEIRQEAQRKRA